MTCPVCAGDTIVIDCRTDCEGVYRRRKCKECNYLFFTSETESDEARQDYNRIMREIHKEQKRKKDLKR